MLHWQTKTVGGAVVARLNFHELCSGLFQLLAFIFEKTAVPGPGCLTKAEVVLLLIASKCLVKQPTQHAM